MLQTHPKTPMSWSLSVASCFLRSFTPRLFSARARLFCRFIIASTWRCGACAAQIACFLLKRFFFLCKKAPFPPLNRANCTIRRNRRCSHWINFKKARAGKLCSTAPAPLPSLAAVRGASFPEQTLLMRLLFILRAAAAAPEAQTNFFQPARSFLVVTGRPSSNCSTPSQ